MVRRVLSANVDLDLRQTTTTTTTTMQQQQQQQRRRKLQTKRAVERVGVTAATMFVLVTATIMLLQSGAEWTLNTTPLMVVMAVDPSTSSLSHSSPELKHVLTRSPFLDDSSRNEHDHQDDNGSSNGNGRRVYDNSKDWDFLSNDVNDVDTVDVGVGVGSGTMMRNTKRDILPQPMSVHLALDVAQERGRDYLSSASGCNDAVSRMLTSYSSSSRYELPTPPDIVARYHTTGVPDYMNKDVASSPTTTSPKEVLVGGVSSMDANKRFLRKTGTTIVGCVAKDLNTGEEYVVLAADTRATDGTTVADKRCEKVHCLVDSADGGNIWCCGAGTSADNDALVRQIRFGIRVDQSLRQSIGNHIIHDSSSTSSSQQQNTHNDSQCTLPRLPPAAVMGVCRRIRNQLHQANGNLGVNLVLGGYDHVSRRAILTAIHPHGSLDQVPYAALGSGGLAAMSVLESGFYGDMPLKEAIQLVQKAVKSGINNDLGSGSQVDMVIIGREGSKYERAVNPEEGLPNQQDDNDSYSYSSSKEMSRSGVNGFGNVPFAVQSVRTIVPSEQSIEHECDIFWKAIEDNACACPPAETII
jgi:20S proteasome subunit beta 2